MPNVGHSFEAIHVRIFSKTMSFGFVVQNTFPWTRVGICGYVWMRIASREIVWLIVKSTSIRFQLIYLVFFFSTAVEYSLAYKNGRIRTWTMPVQNRWRLRWCFCHGLYWRWCFPGNQRIPKCTVWIQSKNGLLLVWSINVNLFYQIEIVFDSWAVYQQSNNDRLLLLEILQCGVECSVQ